MLPQWFLIFETTIGPSACSFCQSIEIIIAQVTIIINTIFNFSLTVFFFRSYSRFRWFSRKPLGIDVASLLQASALSFTKQAASTI